MVLRRLPPDPVQVQIVLGSLMGDGKLVGEPGARHLRITHRADRAAYARWKYERLGSLASEPPRIVDGLVQLDTIVHPLFDDLAPLFHRGSRSRAVDLLRPLGLAVWLTDVGRLELRARSFLPAQRAAMAA